MRILVIRTDRIGDVLLSTPVLSALKERDGDCHITMLVSPYGAGAIEGHPALDKTIVDERTGCHSGPVGFLRLVGDLRAGRFDAALVLHPTARLALACRLAGIQIRIGTGYRGYSFLFNRRVHEHRREARKHEVEYNLSLARALFEDAGEAAPQIHVPESARRAVADRMDRWQVRPGDPLVLLHPGSGGSARNWPADCFTELAGRLARSGVRVVVTGSAAERDLVERVAGSPRDQVIPIAGELDLKELAALLQTSTLCVTNSTGPLHVASAVGTSAVALFCPIKPCSPVRWGPFGGDHDILMPEVPPCPRCIETDCPYFDCMERIAVDHVYETVCGRILAGHPDLTGSLAVKDVRDASVGD